jgi:uncharacterized protein YjbI with pentapeptide repeats
LTGATVAQADFSGTTARGFTQEQLYSTASYQQKNLRGIQFRSGDDSLSGWDLSGQDLTNASFYNANLTNANLAGANLTEAFLSESTLRGANLAGAIVTGTDLSNSGLTKEQLYSTASYQQKNLRGVGFSRNDLTGWDFRGQDLTDASFFIATLTNADLTGAIVTGAGFHDITKEQLYSTASYHQKNLQGIRILDSDLTGWDLRGQDLSNAALGSNLTNANLTGANLTNAGLEFATFTNANLAETNVNGASFRVTASRGFTKEHLYSTASYQQKNLQRIRLSENDLTGWDLSGQDLTRASLDNTQLTNVNLARANLTGADFYGADLANANLSGAIVTGANFFASRGPTNEQLYSTASYQQKNLQALNLGCEVGFDSQCVDVDAPRDLSGWDFSGQDLTDSIFLGANLTNANLTAADLRGAQGVNLTGSVVANTIRPDGQVWGIQLADQSELIVRDNDGRPASPPDTFWLLVRPPRPPTPITVQDEFAMSGTGLVRLVFESDPWDSLITFEPGIPVALGGTLKLTFADDVDVATQVGRTLRIFDWTSVEPTGAFAVESPHLWDLSQLYTTGEVTLLAVNTVPGDFNGDGIVDAADYVVWRNGLGTTYMPSDYELWRSHFGQTAAGGAALASARVIPEPPSLLFAIVLSSAAGFLLRRFRRTGCRPAAHSHSADVERVFRG